MRAFFCKLIAYFVVLQEKINTKMKRRNEKDPNKYIMTLFVEVSNNELRAAKHKLSSFEKYMVSVFL